MTGRLGELIVILLIVFIFFGAGKLPKVINELGRGMKGLRKKEDQDEPSKVTKAAKADSSKSD